MNCSFPPKSRYRIENEMGLLLQEVHRDGWNGKEPVDIEFIFEVHVKEKYGILTGYEDISRFGTGTLGYTDAGRKESFVSNSLIDSDVPSLIRRGRATIAHEIGHCLYHVKCVREFISKSGGEGHYRHSPHILKPYEDPEWQAWEAAMSCLMPKHLIGKYIEKGYDLNSIAEAFDVNPAFVETRLKKLNIRK